MEDGWDSIVKLAESTNGHITTKQAEQNGISRSILSVLATKGSLVRVCRGHYIIADSMTDEYALLQSRCSKAIYSYGTALYFWGLSDRIPHILDMTIPQSTNVSRISKFNSDIRFHYVQPDIYMLGRTQITSPLGSEITLYDKERCICDLIHVRGKADQQLYTQVLKDYFMNKPDIRKLIKYGKQLGVEDKVRAYAEVLL